MTLRSATCGLANRLRCRFWRFWPDASGATAIEYGLIASLIGIAIIGGVTTFGTNLSGQWLYVANIVNPNLSH